MGNRDYRVIFVTHYSQLYGANRSLLNLIDGLLTYPGIEIWLLAPRDGPVVRKSIEMGIRAIVVPFAGDVDLGFVHRRTGIFRKIGKLAFNWWVALRYANLLKSRIPTIVHSNSSATLFGSYLAARMKVPHIWHIREFGWVDCRMIYHFGEPFFLHRLDKAKAAISISNAVQEMRVERSKVARKRVIYNGVIFDESLGKTIHSKMNADEARFAIVGLISETKNQMEALEGFGMLAVRYPNIRLIIVGDGDGRYLESLKERAQGLGLGERVEFTGYLEDTEAVYRSIDFLLMCSKNEAFGRVTIEAMSKGIPVVGFDNAGTREIIRHGYNGFLYSGGAEDLASQMESLLRHPALVDSMKENCVTTVRENYTIDRYVGKVRELHMECLGWLNPEK